MTPEQFNALKAELDASHEAIASLGNRIFVLKEDGATDEVASTFARYRSAGEALKNAVVDSPRWMA